MIFSEMAIYTNVHASLRMKFFLGKTSLSSYSFARSLSSSPWTSLSRMLLHVYSVASHLHSSIHVMMCALHEYLTALLHFTSSANAFGAGDTSETMGMYVPSLSSCHPSPTGSSIVQLCPVPKCWFDSVHAICAE